jgi:serine/threonine-protein kinase
MIGKIINNRYKIISLIAEGGMAHVYKALDIEKDYIVALKILKSQFSGDKDFVDRFMQEAMAFARLNHENIVKLYDYGSVDGLHYLSIEYVEGNSLDELIRENKLLSVQEVLNISVQVCQALEHAHQKKIVHRDIKPHNILVDTKGKVKVTDFGIAKAISSATITHAGGMLGSVQYFSPEQAKGERATEKSDIYSLAVVIYEMLTGKLPFSGETHFSIALKHVQERPVNPSFYNSDIPKNLELIILKALGKKPEYRYESAEAFKEALINYQNISDLNRSEINKNLEESKFSHTVIPKRNQREGREKKAPNKKAYLVAGIIFLLAIFGYIFSQNEKVPDLKGMTIGQAEDVLGSMGLKIIIQREDFSEEAEKGQIISQDPEKGEKVSSGSAVNVVVSAGDEFVIVPDVVGADIDKAIEVLAENSITIKGQEEIYNNDFAEGEVIYQEPARGTKVAPNSLIDLVVSKGKKPLDFPAPSLIGFSKDSALEIITRLNLQPGRVTMIESTEYSEGTVVSQNPLPDVIVQDNSIIDLLVSSGPGPRKFTRAVPVNMEEDGILKIVVQDIQGESTFLQERREKGFFSVQVDYYGEGRILVFLNDRKINEVQVP